MLKAWVVIPNPLDVPHSQTDAICAGEVTVVWPRSLAPILLMGQKPLQGQNS